MTSAKNSIEKERRAMHDRLELLSKELLFRRVSELFKHLGYDRFDMHYQAKIGKRDYSKNFTTALKTKFPQVNIDWLINNRGAMLLKTPNEKFPSKSQDLFMVRDNSMSDYIVRGDELECKHVFLNEIMNFGDTYLIELPQQFVVRYLFKSEGGYILRSNNPERTPDITVTAKEIYSIKKVVKIIRALE